MKKIDTLVTDIHSVLEGHGGWDAAVAAHFNTAVDNLMDARLNPEERGGGTVRMSNVAQPCARKLWYHVNSEAEATPLAPSARLKFLYGDIIEEVLLSLAEAAGHNVQGRQDLMELSGIKGHRDGVIDGMLVDVKSASSASFQKFKDGSLSEPGNDPFGYIGQITAYLAASQSDPLVTYKTEAAFLAMDKQHGHIVLDVYDLTDELERINELVETRKQLVGIPTPPKRGFDDEDDGYWNYKTKPKTFVKNGNKVLGLNCSYCEHKKECWPGLRGFYYSGHTGPRPKYFTKIVKEPKVKEFKV